MPDTASPPPGTGPGRVNVNTVAEAAQVSRQTVTNALRHPERVRPETLSRVQAEIVRLGYRPSSAAQSLQAQRAGAIGVELNALGADYHNAVMAPFVAALTLAAPAPRLPHRHLRLAAPHADPGGLPADVARPRGRRLRAGRHPRRGPATGVAARPGHPVRPPSGGSGTTLGSFAGSTSTGTRHRAAVDHCLGAGYDTVGYLGSPVGVSVVGRRRRAGWQRRLPGRRSRAAGPTAPRPTSWTPSARWPTRSSAPSGAGGAVVCATDVLALGALRRRLARRPAARRRRRRGRLRRLRAGSDARPDQRCPAAGRRRRRSPSTWWQPRSAAPTPAAPPACC